MKINNFALSSAVIVSLLTGCGTPMASPSANDSAGTSGNTTSTNKTEPATAVVASNTSDQSANAAMSNGSTNPSTGANQSGLPQPVPVTSELQALQIVTNLYSGAKKTDPNLTISLDGTSVQNGHTVYQIHVFDDMKTHTATLAWIYVRDDGYLEDYLLPHGWVLPADFFREYPMAK